MVYIYKEAIVDDMRKLNPQLKQKCPLTVINGHCYSLTKVHAPQGE